MIAQTSLIAREQNRQSAGQQSVRVLGMLKRWKKGRTNSELASVLKLPASTVAARINDLKKSGAVEVLGTRRCQVTGFTAKIHSVVR